MRKIGFRESLTFGILITLIAAAAFALSAWLFMSAGAIFAGGMALVYVFALVIYRLIFSIVTFPIGNIDANSREEYLWNLHQLFFLVLFFSITRSNILPIPLTRPVYRALGARLGTNTYAGGALLDPILTTIGSNTIIGHNSVAFAHEIEGEHLALHPITIGNRVTIGAYAVIMPGVSIGDNAIVAVGSVVSKGTRIGDGETWGGTPARCLKRGAPLPP